MKFKVHMLAFCDKGTVREVEVPDQEIPSNDTYRLLDLIFYYGQNDFQPKPFPSVSVGDIIELNIPFTKYFEVKSVGFSLITSCEFNRMNGR